MIKKYCLVLAMSLWAAQAVLGAEFFVSPQGDDGNPGTADKPFRTLERARAAVRQHKSGNPRFKVDVILGGGTYELARPFELGAEDSGTAEAPVVYRAREGETVRLSGGKSVPAWKPVTDRSVLSRLEPAARRHVVQADLKALGVSDFGTLANGPGLELFFNDEPMTLARYPKDGFIKITGVLGATPVDVRGTKGCQEGKFTYEGDRPRRWVGEKEPWAQGYWFWDWAEQRQRIEAIDADKKSITLAKPDHSYGYRVGQWFRGFNLLAELDSPGEWYLDRGAGTLYFWPPGRAGRSGAVVSVLPNLVRMSRVSFLTLRGMIFEAGRKDAILMEDCAHCGIVGATIRNVGGYAVRVQGGQDVGVVGCDIYATGDRGISLAGGDLTTLTPAGLYAENNHVHHWSRWNRMYQPGIAIAGVGNRAAHNLLENAPHCAIIFGGNDHVIEFNEIHSVCYESNDAGAIYCGRNWTMRGTVIRCNYLHDISGFEGRGCVGVYLDDMYCGTVIGSNLFYRVTSAAFIGGGHDDSIVNNIFVDCEPAVHVDARGLGWAHEMPERLVKEGREQGTLDGIHFAQPPYSGRYPQLIGILDDHPAAPTGNLIALNVCRGGRWDDLESAAKPFIMLRDNLLDQDPRFVNAAEGNFQLRADSPAFQLGFRPFPIEQIGIYRSPDRASWPVRHAVRPMAKRPAH